MWTTSTEYDAEGNIVNMERIEVPDPPTAAVETTVVIDVAELDAATTMAEKATTLAGLRTATLRLITAIKIES